MTDLADDRERPRIFRNDYGPLTVPRIGEWEPSLPVSVVIPALGGQDKLDLVLAALSEQTYPSHLMEAVVVDDGTEPPLTLPEHRPERTRLLRTPEGQWGISGAVNTGIEAAEGDIILRVDSDTLLSRVHVESQARWHHRADYLMVLGAIIYVTDPELAGLTPGDVAAATAAGRLGQRFAPCQVEENWGAERIRSTDRLTQLDARAYSVANGPSVSFRKAFWKEVGGLREDLLLGEDTELGYRFAQYGAVLIPDRNATAWHFGATTAMTRPDDADRARMPAVANCIPLNRHLRKAVGHVWEVPLVEVVVDADGAAHEDVCATVDSLLADRAADLAVTVTGDWNIPDAGRYPALDDPDADARLPQRYFAGDPRVAFAARIDGRFPTAPFRLAFRAGITVLPGAVPQLVELAESRRVGLIEIVITGGEDEFQVAFERTAALARARRLRLPGESVLDAVDAVWGVWFASGDDWFQMPGAPDGTEAKTAEAASEVERLRIRLAAAELEIARQRERAEKWKDKSQNHLKMVNHWKELAETWRGRARSSNRPTDLGPLRRLARHMRSKRGRA